MKPLKKFEIDFAFDVQAKLNQIAEALFPDFDVSKIICMRSHGSKSRALARIWPLERAWQIALDISPHYIIEVVEPAFSKLLDEGQERTLIHELLHIPKTFSGSLIPHRCFGRQINEKCVRDLHKKFKSV